MTIGRDMTGINLTSVDAKACSDTFTIKTNVNLNSVPGIRIGNAVIHNTGIAFGITTYNSPETMPEETKTYLYIDNGRIRVATYKNGKRNTDSDILPEIANVETINDKVVKVYFSDNTEEKAVTVSGDVFNIEQGVSTCIAKKLLSMVSNGNGSSVYNKLIDRAMRIYTDNMETIRKTNEEAETARKREEKRISRAKKKREKRELLLREREIEIQKEAYLRAMIEFNKNSSQE